MSEVKEELVKEVEVELSDLQKEAIRIKRKHGVKKLFCIEVEDEDSGEWVAAWVQKPNLKVFSMFSKIAQEDNIKALKVLLTNIFLEGDKRILEDDDFFLAAMSQLEEIVSVQASRIKKY